MRANQLAAPLLVVLAAGCVFRGVRVESLHPDGLAEDITDERIAVTSPVKAHLFDGHTVVFESGATFTRDSLLGIGARYDVALGYVGADHALPFDSVAAVETFHTTTNVGASVGVSLAVAAGTALAAGALALAIFGSCPTVYSDSAGMARLEAEAFSYAIAPLFESRDVDRLHAAADPDGRVRLEIRNEALETHYIDHLELLEARHDPSEMALPGPDGRALAVRSPRPARRAVDAAGRDVTRALAVEDGVAFRSDAALLRAAGSEAGGPAGREDRIELTAPIRPGADSAALVLRLRNSLLTTVLFYDLMLADRGARALDWIGRDLEEIGSAVALGRWAVETLGLRVFVWDGREWVPAGRIPDAGPLAWKDVGLVVPVPEGSGPELRLRLSFVADHWRIDRMAVAEEWRYVEARAVPLERVVGADGADDPGALAGLSAPDANRVITTPGQRFDAVFAVGPQPAGGGQTFFIAYQGYYVEWMRREWLRHAPRPEPFEPGDAALAEVLQRWSQVQDDLESRFAYARVPVR